MYVYIYAIYICVCIYMHLYICIHTGISSSTYVSVSPGAEEDAMLFVVRPSATNHSML